MLYEEKNPRLISILVACSLNIMLILEREATCSSLL